VSAGSATSARRYPVAGRRLRGLGRPARRGFMATGHQYDVQHGCQLDAHLLEHVPDGSARRHELLPQRGLTTAHGQKLAEQVGIKGVNLDEWTSGPSTININRGSPTRCWGLRQQPAVDRWSAAGSSRPRHEGPNNHTIKFGGNWRRTVTSCCRPRTNQGPPRRVHVTAQPDVVAGRHCVAERPGQRVRVVPARPAERHARDLKVLEDVGSQHWAL